MKTRRTPHGSTAGGFSLLELVIVITIIGMLAFFAVPRYQQTLERAHAMAGVSWLSQIQAAQERHAIYEGIYARDLRWLDVAGGPPASFRVASFTSGNWETGWRIVLQRTGASHGYGAYQLVWTQDGFDRQRSSVPDTMLPAGVRTESSRQPQVGTTDRR